MHGFVIVLLPEDAMRQDKINLLMEIEERVYPYKSFYHKGDDRPCRCTEHGASPESSCRDCQGTGRTRHNPKGKLDYWLLGGRFDGYIRTGKTDSQKSIGNFLLEFVYGQTAVNGLLFHEDEHDDVDTNVVSAAQINMSVLKENWITPDVGWVEDIFTVTDDPREHYKGYWAAGLDYHR